MQERSKEFRGEVWTGVHPRIMEAILKANDLPVDGCVGKDSHTLYATSLMQRELRAKIAAVYTVSGTAANILALKMMLDPWSAVICAKETHINVYECGALEYNLGNKILYADSEDGKLSPNLLDTLMKGVGKYHYLPKVVVVTQPTEFGTVYTEEELSAVTRWAHERGMYVYLDGARLANALVARETTIGAMIEGADVDVFSFGGTKAGCMFGEMVVFRREQFANNLDYAQKQSLQHMDKSRYLGAQMAALLETELWRENARIANEKARVLADRLERGGYPAYYPVESNAVFITVSPERLARLNTVYDFHYWNEFAHTVRLVTTYATSDGEMDRLLRLLTE